jgi:hypothetical protein
VGVRIGFFMLGGGIAVIVSAIMHAALVAHLEAKVREALRQLNVGLHYAAGYLDHVKAVGPTLESADEASPRSHPQGHRRSRRLGGGSPWMTRGT